MDASETKTSCGDCERILDKLHALSVKLQRLQQQLAELAVENAQLRSENRQLQTKVKKLNAENAELQQELQKLKAELDAAQKNAKRQTVRFPRRQRKAKPGKPGRKTGTPATPRPRPPKVDREIDVPVPHCPDCGCSAEKIEVHQQFQTDLPPVTPTTTQFNVPVGSCPRCGQRLQGHHPEQISDALGAAAQVIGPQAQTMAAQLKHDAGLSYAKISRFLWDFHGLRTAASTFVRAGQRLARRALPTFEWVKGRLRLQHVVHADETGWRIGIQSDWLWVFSSPEFTIYRVGGGRGQDIPREILGDDFAGVLVSDGLASYDPLRYLKAQCVGHVLARISKLKTALCEPHVWHLESLEALLQEAIDLDRRRLLLTDKGFRRRIRELENELDIWLLLNEHHPQPDVGRLARHIQKHRHQWFMFLYDPLVPPTNNHAERMIRPAVIIRKLGGCNKTPIGAKVHSVLASLIVSCRQQGKRFLDLARLLFHLPSPQAIPLTSLPSG